MRLVESYGDPLEADVAIGNMDTLDLVRRLRALASDGGLKLGMTIGDIVRFQRDCRASATPYIHAKRLSVAMTPPQRLPVFGLGRYQPTDGAAGRSIEDAIDVTPKAQPDQQDSETPAGGSDEGKSDD